MPPIPAAQTAEPVYLTSRKVRQRYGRSYTWLWRRVKNDPTFPKPLYIAGQRYWLQSDLERYERGAVAAA